MAHGDYTLWMSLALDGKLSPGEEQALRRHLAECSECRALWETWTLLDERLHAAPMAAPAPGFPARVDARLRARQLRRRGTIGGLLVLAGSIAIWSALLVSVTLVATWWLVDNPWAFIRVTHIILASLAAASGLLRAMHVLWESLAMPPMQPLLAGYVAIMLGLAILWVYAIRRRGRGVAG